MFVKKAVAVALFVVGGFLDVFGFLMIIGGIGGVFQGTWFGIHGAGLPTLVVGLLLLLISILLFKIARNVSPKSSVP